MHFGNLKRVKIQAENFARAGLGRQRIFDLPCINEIDFSVHHHCAGHRVSFKRSYKLRIRVGFVHIYSIKTFIFRTGGNVSVVIDVIAVDKQKI